MKDIVRLYKSVIFTERKITAGHDISDGGFVTCMLEMAFAGNCGLDVNIQHTEGNYCSQLIFMAICFKDFVFMNIFIAIHFPKRESY